MYLLYLGHFMKRMFLSLLIFVLFNSVLNAEEVDDVRDFFNRYVDTANSYGKNYFDYYDTNAKIFRVVEKEDGTKEVVSIPMERYKAETKKSTKLAKIRRYKNRYLNIRIFGKGDDYMLIAERMPSTSDYVLPAYFIIGKDNSGNWKIKEESMNTRVLKFLKEAEKSKLK